ncbi:ABC transporter permease [Microbacterium halotolerans]|uniref:ABC transporter permease n=1 Tax=Microbacterium halotolerans TaxID=246613 RepID=UPI000E6ABE4A|nr:ABC transporter permease [Microbacterium halotolerans]
MGHGGVNAVDLKDYNVPGRGRGLADVFRWRYLLKVLVRKATSTRYRNSALGWTWSYARPLVQFLIYWLVMGKILGVDKGIDNFPLYIFSGFVTIQFFNGAFQQATSSIVANKALVKKIYMPRELFPVAAVINGFIHFLPQLAILLVVALLYGWRPDFIHIGAVLLGLIIIGALSLGMGILFAGINVRYRDADNFGELIRQVVLWLSPVLYPWRLISETLGDVWVYLYFCNPISVAVELMHFGFWSPTVPPFHATDEPGGWFGFPPAFGWYIGGALVLSLLLLLLGQYTFRRFERTFAQDV